MSSISARSTSSLLRKLRVPVALATAGAATLAMAGLAGAAPPEPTYGSAVVDGYTSDWNLNEPNSDLFSFLEVGGEGAAEGRLFVRYNCATNELFMLVRTVPGVQLDPNADPSSHFARVHANGPSIVDGNAAGSGNFAYIDQNADGVADGWEARAVVAIGSYPEFNVGTQVLSDGAGGSGTEVTPKDAGEPLAMSCPDTTPPPPPPPPPVVDKTPPPSTTPTSATPTPVLRARRPRTRIIARKQGPARVRAGRGARYVLRVTNRGRNRANRVIVRDILPRGMVLVRRPAGATIRGRTITWRISGIAPGRTVRRTVRVRVLRNVRGRRVCNRMIARGANTPLSRATRCSRIVRVRAAQAFLPAVTG